MRFTFLSVFLLFAYLSSSAQDVLFEDVNNDLFPSKSIFKTVKLVPVFFKDSILICYLKGRPINPDRESLVSLNFTNNEVKEINLDSRKEHFFLSESHILNGEEVFTFRGHQRNFGKSKFYMDNFNFDSGRTTSKEIEIEFKKEKILGKFSNDGKFYLLTKEKNTNHLKIRVITQDGLVKNHYINDEKGNPIEFNYELNHLEALNQQSHRVYNADYVPENSKLIADNKCFVGDNGILLMHETPYSCKLLKIELADFTSKAFSINKPSLPMTGDFESFRSTSFINDSKLCQFAGSKKQFIINIHDIANDSLICSKKIEGNNDLFETPYPIRLKEKPFRQEYKKILNYQNTGLFFRDNIDHFKLNICGYTSGGTMRLGPSGVGSPTMISTGPSSNIVELSISKEKNELDVVKPQKYAYKFKGEKTRFFNFKDQSFSSLYDDANNVFKVLISTETTQQ